MRQIRQRRTHRGGFDSLPLSPDLLAALRRGAARDGTTLRIMAEDGRRVLAATVQAAERALRLDSARVQELARWASPPRSGRPDGVPPTSYTARPEHTSPDYPGRDFAHGHGWGLPLFSPAPWLRSAGTVGMLTTADDQPTGLDQCRTCASADPADGQHMRGRGGPAQPAAGAAAASRGHPCSAVRRRIPTASAAARDDHPGSRQRAASARGRDLLTRRCRDYRHGRRDQWPLCAGSREAGY